MSHFEVEFAITLSKGVAPKEALLRGLDVSEFKTAAEKAELVSKNKLESIQQSVQLNNPDMRISFKAIMGEDLLENYASSIEGLTTGDMPRFVQFFWEQYFFNGGWAPYMGGVTSKSFFGGREQSLKWDGGQGVLRNFPTAHNFPSEYMNGHKILGKKGIRIAQMGQFSPTITYGEVFDKNSANLVAHESDEEINAALWCFIEDDGFYSKVKDIDQALKVTNASFLKIEFDKYYWISVAKIKYPHGLPKPYTNDQTQWIFHGHPCASVIWDEASKWTKEGPVRFDESVLQVAVARLLGYQWPAELDEEMELADEQRQLVDEVAKLNAFADEDGIVCLPAVRGEAPAHTRLEKLLVAAYEDDWKNGALDKLLTAVGSKSLELWLRDKFFEQHCKLFQHRPFIWHIWDGLKDGFSALVNYHKLDRSGLERLIYTYLGDWIRIQEQGVKEARDGAEERLTAAKNLQQRLEAILAGEKGLDIFVRWKPLAEQPIGWEPDLNDGVRLNIRPFLKAADVGKKGAGILRFKPNINWNKDRGNDVASAPWYTLGLQYGEKEGARINDHHLSLEDKRAARANQPK